MLKSMTAYGRSAISTPLGRFSVEIQSVNRKHLEISTFLPREMTRFDPLIKGWISGKIARGSILLKLNIVFEKETPLTVTPNLPLAKQLKSAWDAIAKELGLDSHKSFSLSLISKELGILLYDENIQSEAEYEKTLNQAIEEALEHLIAMKVTEGKALQTDISNRLRIIEKALEFIEEKAPNATEKYRKKLQDKLKEVATPSPELEERLLREVLIYAEKMDISEEITRFKSHLKQFWELLDQEKAVGKTLDFLLQELFREINTLGSKASDVDVTRNVVQVKSELEKIREQIQNVE